MQNTGQILRSRKNGKSKYTAISNEILQSSTLTPQEKGDLYAIALAELFPTSDTVSLANDGLTVLENR